MKEKYLVRHGGLMRCCLKTLDDAMVAAAEPPKEGDIIHCAFHDDNGGMIFRNGGWEWNHDFERTRSR